MEINTKVHEPEEMADLFSRLIGKPVGEAFGLFPPFYTGFGKNITIGDHVFINSDCKFQDQGGITIDDGALIGHGVVLATLNHEDLYGPITGELSKMGRILFDLGAENAYTLDGGQTASMIVNGELINSVEFGYQRAVSDIIYFATALPERQKWEAEHG